MVTPSVTYGVEFLPPEEGVPAEPGRGASRCARRDRTPSVAYGDTSPQSAYGLTPSVACGDTSPNGRLRSLGEETGRFAPWGRKRVAPLLGRK